MPWDTSVHDHLSTLYRRAAQQLERDGDVEGAAFVYADLLDSPRDAVTVLERHGRHGLAARLAEGRELDPALVVRLWWLAGNRRRAIDVARARGAWAAAIARLEGNLPGEAAALRAEWVAAARRAGDRRLAVEAAWPDPELRRGLGDDLRALRRRGGRPGARALVRELALRPDEALRAEAAALIGSREPSATAVRSAFAEELAAFPADDPAADRQLATQTMRALLREPGPKDVRAKLRDRVDPLLRADVPAVPRADAAHVPLLVADGEPGGAALRDAVVLDHGLLIATGEHGLQLLTLDGRARGRWDIPADSLCVADHGDSVLAVGRGESLVELHRFELATCRARRRGSLSRSLPLGSFDGGTVTTIDADGLADVDVTEDEPRELWRHLAGDTVVLDIARSPESMSAIVDTPLQGGGERSLELWSWELPSRRLSRRELADGRWDESARTTASGRLLRSEDGDRFLVSGDVEGVLDPDGPQVVLRTGGRPLAVVELPVAEDLRMRAHADVACVWAPDGRVVAVDLVTRSAIANLTVRSST